MKPSKILSCAFVISILSAANIYGVAYATETLNSDFSPATEATTSTKKAIQKQTPIKVEIIEENGKYQLLRGGETVSSQRSRYFVN